MKTKLLLFSLFAAVSLTAQTVSIPDPNFEQALINKGIDSDGIVNGQILSVDAESVIELNIEGPEFYEAQIADLTGLEAFTNLENFQITYTQITTLDVSHNIKLKTLFTLGNYLTNLDVSSNVLLEDLYVSNSDMGPLNEIEVLDLSNNPNIKKVTATDVHSLKRVNLKNGSNNTLLELSIGFTPWGDDPANIYNTVCIEVDNVELAQNNQSPYSQWTIYHLHAQYNFSENCALSAETPVAGNDIFVYPNPVSGTLYLQYLNTPANVQLFDLSGRLVREYNNVGAQGMDVSALEKGMYVVKTAEGKSVKSQKIIVE